MCLKAVFNPIAGFNLDKLLELLSGFCENSYYIKTVLLKIFDQNDKNN